VNSLDDLIFVVVPPIMLEDLIAKLDKFFPGVAVVIEAARIFHALMKVVELTMDKITSSISVSNVSVSILNI
jgi:hypothetical protein